MKVFIIYIIDTFFIFLKIQLKYDKIHEKGVEAISVECFRQHSVIYTRGHFKFRDFYNNLVFNKKERQCYFWKFYC